MKNLFMPFKFNFYLVWSAVTNSCRLAGRKSKHLGPMVLETGKFKVPADLVSGEGLLPYLKLTANPWRLESRERKQPLSCLFP